MVQVLNKITDQVMIHTDRTWDEFKHIQKGFERARNVRLFYFDGVLEVLMPGREHEIFASLMGFFVMTFLIDKGIDFDPTRSMTQERSGVASVQADESFCINGTKSIPDLSIEIVYTSGGINKLDRYRALGVPEVWFWEDGTIAIYHLKTAGYEQRPCSELVGLKDLDIDLLRRCILIAQTDKGQALQMFRAGI